LSNDPLSIVAIALALEKLPPGEAKAASGAGELLGSLGEGGHNCSSEVALLSDPLGIVDILNTEELGAGSAAFASAETSAADATSARLEFAEMSQVLASEASASPEASIGSAGEAIVSTLREAIGSTSSR
jgi:hypothetical protein